MPKPNQIPVTFRPDQRARLKQLSDESGRPIAALVRDAVDRLIASPDASAESLWAVLRDPTHWQTFKQIAAQMEPAAAAPPIDDPPTPVYRHQRPVDAPPRARRTTPPETQEEKPF